MNKPAVDRDGHLRDLNQWTPEVASRLAADAGVNLSDEHWAVINVVRDFYQRTQVSPAMRPLVKMVRKQVGVETGNSVRLHELFPESPARVIARIAGLPRPKNCL
ncbi:MAG: TusE/DsrC/DsvC family sulfur relay protein [Gammaproteobacteria bacterium]|nr:TusE/DsrC/DsvC family sulfur relay protein [Gammaproteobacteria bacterium]